MSDIQVRLVGGDADPTQQTINIKTVDGDGKHVDVGGYTLPAATTAAIGGVKEAAVTPLVAAANATAAAGDAPTKAEFDALVTLANANKAAINSLINTARSAGQAASS